MSQSWIQILTEIDRTPTPLVPLVPLVAPIDLSSVKGGFIPKLIQPNHPSFINQFQIYHSYIVIIIS